MAVVGNAELLAKTGDELAEAEYTSTSATRTFVSVYKVITDSITDGPYIVATAPGIPALGDPWEFPDGTYDFGVKAHKFGYKRTAPYLFEVTVTYDLIENVQLDKLNLSPVPEFSTEEKAIPCQGTMSGSQFNFDGPLKNSAGEVFNPPLMVPLPVSILTIQRYEPIANDPSIVKAMFEQTVNTDVTWTNWQTPYCRMREITAKLESQTINSQPVYVWNYTYKIEFNPLGQHEQLLDQGTYYLNTNNPSNKPQTPFKCADGTPRVGLLDGAGNPLADGGTPAFLNKQVYPEISWAPLNLPQSVYDCLPT